MVATVLASAVPTKASEVIVVYKQDWESEDHGWFSKFPDDPVVRVEDPNAPSGTYVQQITSVTAAGHYFSPFIAVTPGKTYEVCGWIKWIKGGWPFIGINQYTAAADMYFRWENWLIGMEGYLTGLDDTDTVTPVPEVDGWHWYSKTFTIADGTTYIRLKDELWQTQGRGGSVLPAEGYFDDIALCEVVEGDGIPLFSDILAIMPLGIVAGAVVIRRRRKANN